MLSSMGGVEVSGLLGLTAWSAAALLSSAGPRLEGVNVIASTLAIACAAISLCLHATLLCLHLFLRESRGLAASGLATLLSTMLLVLLSRTTDLRQLRWLVGLFLCTAALHGWWSVVAALALGQSPPTPSWLGVHFFAIRLACVAAQTVSLVVASAALLVVAVQGSRAAHGDSLWEPLLDGRADEEHGASQESGKRWQLVYGVLKYVWPDSLQLQLRLMMCFLLILLGRVVNLAVPLAFKRVVDTLSNVSAHVAKDGAAATLRALCAAGADPPAFTFWDVFLPWVAAYLALYFLQGGSGGGGSVGLLSNLRQLLWIPITQRAYKRVSVDVFQHLLALDHSYHLKRNTGKVMRILDRGTSSIQDVMSVVLFNVVPQLIDVVAACTYMAVQLQPWTAIVVFVTVSTYIPLTLLVTEWRGKVRKHMNALDNDKEGKATDMLLNYETVKVFGNEQFELRHFGGAIDAYQGAEYLQLACVALLNMGQSAVVFVGLALGLVVCVRGIVAGQLTVGDVVLFLTLMNQLYTPLSFIGSYYRQVQKGLIDCENMFDLLQTQPAVTEMPQAQPLVVREGEVSFRDVVFGYNPAHPILKGVSFTIPGGKTLALVGSTGSGKSTVLRLLLRFWDPQSGSIRIDGTDIRNVTLASLRAATAVVPQDCVLFNESLRYNIRYGRPSASDEEVEEAARVAAIHDAITLRFRKGYDTVVGERGLRLSGGEKQRVAFARAVLHSPSILVLDEATSALDSLTERMIQDSLSRVRQTCTTIIVAHRLSTILDADSILVFENGTVVEQGSHLELLQRGGAYTLMWQRQQDMGASHTTLTRLFSNVSERQRQAEQEDEDTGSNDNDERQANGGTPESGLQSPAGKDQQEHEEKQRRQRQRQKRPRRPLRRRLSVGNEDED